MKEMPACARLLGLRFDFFPLLRSKMLFVHWNGSDAFELPKFIQTKNALPTMFLSGTKPQYRESSELSRLSPIMK
jgi:hypothetical protein